MPTYEYHCRTCGADFEKFQSIKAAPLTHCECGKGGEVQRKISGGSGLIFKGSGFYETDYKRGPAPKEGGGESKPASAPSSSPAPAPAAAPAGGAAKATGS
jgi:putative FmdB family regulatory protein